MGLGAIGGVVTASLADAGEDVVAVTTNASIHAATSKVGLTVIGDGANRNVLARVTHGVPFGETFDYVILATQPPQVEDAARMAAPLLAPTGAMVCLQNGLCEDRVAKIVGDDRVVGGVVAWGALMPETGVYERTAPGGFTLGLMDGVPLGPSRDLLVRALEAVGPVETTDNLRGKRWSKLAINCAISSLGTIGGDRLGALMPHRFIRRIALEIMTEVVAVARREGVRLEKVSGTIDLPWIALDAQERASAGSPSLMAKHALLLAVGFRYRRMRSSMLGAIERGRPPAVDFLNGEVVERARKHGMAVPVNEAIRDAVWAIARGEKNPGIETLRTLYDALSPFG
jgi:2-dehydropantoate 2-reductase